MFTEFWADCKLSKLDNLLESHYYFLQKGSVLYQG